LVIINFLFWGISYILIDSNGNSLLDPYSMWIQTYSILDIFLIYCYTGRRGYDSKWWRIATYIYYPVHLAVIGIVFALLFP
jgi:hypothetical protein